jgi:hypothetical protein
VYSAIMKNNQKGFGAIEAILILVILAIIGFVGWYALNRDKASDSKSTASQSSQNTTDKEDKKQAEVTDPYAGWSNCKDASEGLSFKYPANWNTDGTTKDNPCGISTPAAASMDGAYVHLRSAGDGATTSFRVSYFGNSQAKGSYNFADSSYKGETILDVTPLTVSNAPKPLYVVTYASNNVDSSKAAGLVLTDQTYTVGQKISGSIPFAASKKSGKGLNLSASLAAKNNNQSVEYLPLSEYKNHPDYQAVINMFKSLSY